MTQEDTYTRVIRRLSLYNSSPFAHPGTEGLLAGGATSNQKDAKYNCSGPVDVPNVVYWEFW